MYKNILLLFIGILIIHSCTKEKKALLSEGDKAYYEIPVNEQFQVDLFSNASTGYSWKWANKSNIDIINFVSQEYVSDYFSNRQDGAGGKEIWKFKGIKSGTDSIIMVYCRPWDANSAGDSTTIVVKIQ